MPTKKFVWMNIDGVLSSSNPYKILTLHPKLTLAFRNKESHEVNERAGEYGRQAPSPQELRRELRKKVRS